MPKETDEPEKQKREFPQNRRNSRFSSRLENLSFIAGARRREQKRLGLCDSDFRVLEVLLNKGPLPVNTIGHKVELTTGSITAAVDRLEGKNLVVRKNDANDRRVRLVELTPEGLRLSKKMFAEHRRDMEKAAQALDSDERAVLINLLKRLGKENYD